MRRTTPVRALITGLVCLTLGASTTAQTRQRQPPPSPPTTVKPRPAPAPRPRVEPSERKAPRPAPRPAPQPVHRPAVRGQFVFVGGYFYDPYFGPYPWWGPGRYAYPYFPVFDRHAEVRLRVEPETAAVYVDGFYAGIVDDFNGVFQRLALPPGGHTIELYLDGYRTVRRSLYLAPASSVTLRETLMPLPAGAASEPPLVHPPVPAPPEGSYRPPVTTRRDPLPPQQPPPALVTFGTLALTFAPTGAEVVIDGQPWTSSEPGHLAIAMPPGPHRVEVSERGYMRFSEEIEVRAGETTTLNVSLVKPS
ncbi:MAG: PEGA domain-containing protein [Vicinamibacterales bacterium]